MRMLDLAPGQSVPSPSLLFVNVSWCGHCHAAKPVMADVARRLGSALPVVSVDGDRHAALVRRWKIQGYPTILFVAPGGRATPYPGERTARDIGDWACQQSGRCGMY
jgi:thioredoxin-like negative regulator of GroEL